MKSVLTVCTAATGLGGMHHRQTAAGKLADHGLHVWNLAGIGIVNGYSRGAQTLHRWCADAGGYQRIDARLGQQLDRFQAAAARRLRSRSSQGLVCSSWRQVVKAGVPGVPATNSTCTIPSCTVCVLRVTGDAGLGMGNCRPEASLIVMVEE